MNRIIVYSGGFDSLCLLHDILEIQNEEDKVTLLYFNYGQKNLEQELRVVNNVANKFNVGLKVMAIPNFSWSDSSLVSGSDDKNNQYIPMRNVIFLSYALSYAETIKAQEIYFGFINPGEGEYYTDTSPEFVEWANSFALTQGISVVAPLIDYTKDELIDYIFDYKISKDDFFSCNVPIDGKPCGVCGDCVDVNDLYNEVLVKEPLNILIESGFDYKNPEVKEKLYSLDIPVTSAKLFINNSCNAKCKHCYMDHLSRKADIDVYKAIDTLVAEGVTYIDFFGKEPLVNREVFDYAHYIRNEYPEVTYAMITNGLNLEEYKDLVVEYFEDITISLEGFDPLSRPLPEGLQKTIKYLVSKGVSIQISLDLLKSNYYGIIPTIKKLNKLGVSSVYVKPIFKIGVTTDESIFVNATELGNLIIDLAELNQELDVEIIFEMKQPHLDMLREEFSELYQEVIEDIEYNRDYVFRGMTLELEFYCSRYQGGVTISPYGHVLGCGFEMSLPYESQAKMGHVNNLFESIKEGKRKHCYLKNNCKNSCYFS